MLLKRAELQLALAITFTVSAIQANSSYSAPAREARESRPPLVRISPTDGARAALPGARFDIRARLDLREVAVVVSRQPFDPSGWLEPPHGEQWIVLPYREAPLALESIGLEIRNDTELWWAAVARDPATGGLVASTVGHFTALPRFANRVAPDATVQPSASGRIPAAGAPTASSSRAPIALASGYTVTPGGAAPELPADLARRVPVSPGGQGRTGYLVQFADGDADSARARIERAGARLVASMPGGSYLVRLDQESRARLEASGGTPWLSGWEPAYRLSPVIDRASSASQELTALVFPDGDAESVADSLRSMGATKVRVHRGDLNQVLHFELPGTRVAEAAALSDMLWIEPTEHDSLTNDQDQWVVQTSIQNSRRVWDMGIRGQGQVVMTSDSGIRTNHEMFDDPTNEITGFGDYPSNRKIIAYQRGSDSPEIAFGDESSADFHGTHTAGTVAGNSDPTGTGQYDGIAKDAKLYFMDLAGPTSGSSLQVGDDLNDLFLPSYLGNAGGAARISSNSWGAQASGAYTIASMQLDQFIWNHPDYLIAFANGNNGFNGTVNSPATAKDCLSVGGTGNGTLENTYYRVTSRGPTSDLRRKPTICTPGDLVTSSVGNTRWSYATYSGTSMATPGAAGALALAREYLTEGWYPTGAPVASNAMNPSAALLKAMAINSGDNDITGYFVPDNNLGWGRLDLDNVLYFPGDARHTLLIDSKKGLADQQYVEYQVRVTDSTQPLTVSLCWTDAPGNPAAAVQLVNDLDLIVTNGISTFLGNHMFNGASLAGGPRDSVNVEEEVRVPSPATGVWTVRVEGHHAPMGPQPFAICVTGSVGQGAGSVALDRYDYALTDTIGIEVLDTNVSHPPTVTVSSPTDAWGETVQLDGANGVYRGSLAIAPSLPSPYDHRLSVSAGDVITVTYADASPPATISAHATVNAGAPVVTNVHSAPLSYHSALVTWSTDIAASSVVHFGSTAALASTADSSEFAREHHVLVTGLQPGTTYRYDVESASDAGEASRDSLGGAHRTFTTGAHGQIALVMDSPSAKILSTWTNAFQALGWNVDVLTGAETDPPLVGDASAGLRSYAAVLWQVDTEAYPPLSDAQRTAVDSLLEGGGRLLIMGHDLGYGLSDAAAPSYTPEREAWLESGLKTRYYSDVYGPDLHLYGVAGDPVSGAWSSSGLSYHEVRTYATSDVVVPAPGTDGVGVVNWLDDQTPQGGCGIRWESNGTRGVPGSAIWAGATSRLLAQYFEWAAFGTTSAANDSGRTAQLKSATEYLLGHRIPLATITSPLPGQTITGDFLPILYTMTPDSGRVVATRTLYYSLDGGESWWLIDSRIGSDPGFIWDLGGALGGPKIPNSARVRLKLVVTDDGSPSLRGETAMTADFTLSRASGDTRGPALVAGSERVSPTPIRAGSPATLSVAFTDAALGNSHIGAAEYSWGASPAAAGSGVPMTLAADSSVASATASLGASIAPGSYTLWVRARDSAGNWGGPTSLAVTANGAGVLDVQAAGFVDFLAPARPNPSRGNATIEFGLSRAGDVRLELFDIAGRRVRTLAGGFHAAGRYQVSWDRHDDAGERARAGVYFVRLEGPHGTFRARMVALD